MMTLGVDEAIEIENLLTDMMLWPGSWTWKGEAKAGANHEAISNSKSSGWRHIMWHVYGHVLGKRANFLIINFYEIPSPCYGVISCPHPAILQYFLVLGFNNDNKSILVSDVKFASCRHLGSKYWLSRVTLERFEQQVIENGCRSLYLCERLQ